MFKDQRAYQFLVIEDNTGDYVLVEEYLEEVILAPKIIRAVSFRQASDLLVGQGIQVDAILLDLSLPDKAGEVLINDVLAIAQHIPVIILTGFGDERFAIRSLSLGVSDYLLKDHLNPTVLYKSIVYNIERNKNLVVLKESEQRYADLFHLSPLPMWVYDQETLRFLDVNDAAIRHYGYDREEFLAMTIRDIRPIEDLPRLEQIIAESIEPARFNQIGDLRHVKKNGAVIQVEVQSNRITYQGRKAKIVLVNDITERLLHIQAIEAQNEKLREIAWFQSHVVRAPLARIMALISLITEDVVSGKERTECLEHILHSASELDVVIKDIVSKTEQIAVLKRIS